MAEVLRAGRTTPERQGLEALRARVRAATLRPEADASGEIIADLAGERPALERARARAARWVETARADRRSRPLLDRMLEQFPLDSAQGRALMSLAEALLRTPDPKRADQLIAERLAALRGAGLPVDTDLLLRTGFTLLGAAGKLLPEVSAELSGEFSPSSLTKPMIAPIVRAALRQSMQLLGHAFIVGETIDAALARGRAEPGLALCSFDVLGEGARTEADAQRYCDAYRHAIEALGGQPAGLVHQRSGISVKLSALEPRYTQLQSARVNERLAPRMLELARQAARAGIGFTIDAEEADRLDLSLDIVESLARDPATRAWEGLGLAVQAYGRRAPLVLDWVAALAQGSGRRMTVRLVNSTFVHQFRNPQSPVEEVVRYPLASLAAATLREARLREPRALYGAERANSEGEDFGDPAALAALEAEVQRQAAETCSGGPVLSGRTMTDASTPVVSPADTRVTLGLTRDASAEEIRAAMQAAHEAQPAWDARGAAERAACLERAAELLQARRGNFLSLLVREAGKTLPDALAELREAIDFCRYYAARGRELFGAPQELPGPTGERNELSLHGRGVFVCISPWNFPLAIFTGQITAALAAGNAVVAKPAPATPLIAHAVTRLLHEAGVPEAVLQLTPADGPPFGDVALRHPALAGVAFTGSTATAATINRTLAAREGPIVPLIAETGGVNAMVVDATALPEQVVDDVLASAFTSAGQRCSALRVLYLQEETADRIIEMLIGAMRLLKIGPPQDLATDVGPVISAAARQRLARHVGRMRTEAKLLYVCEMPPGLAETGHFFPPHLIELRTLDQLRTEEDRKSGA